MVAKLTGEGKYTHRVLLLQRDGTEREGPTLGGTESRRRLTEQAGRVVQQNIHRQILLFFKYPYEQAA